MLEQEYFGNSILRWIVAAAIVLGAAVFGGLCVKLLKALVQKMGSQLTRLIVEGTSVPITLLVSVFGIRIASESLVLPSKLVYWVTSGTTLLIAIIITWLGVCVYDALHKGVFEPYARRPESPIELHLFVVLRTLVHVVVWAVGIATGLNSIGFEVTAILAGLGIGGVALALASQDTVANIFGGVIVLTQRPFKVGERVEVAGVNGWVQHIGLRNTIIRNWYGRLVLVPNKKFTDSIVTNIDSQSCYYFEVRPRLDAWTRPEQVEQAIQILRDIVNDIELLDKGSWVMLDKIAQGYLELEFWFSVSRWSPQEQDRFSDEYQKICLAKTQVNLEILRRFEAAGLRLALPLEVKWEVHSEPGGPWRTPPMAQAEPKRASGTLP